MIIEASDNPADIEYLPKVILNKIINDNNNIQPRYILLSANLFFMLARILMWDMKNNLKFNESIVAINPAGQNILEFIN